VLQRNSLAATSPVPMSKTRTPIDTRETKGTPPVLGSWPPTAAEAELPSATWSWLCGAEAMVVAEGEALADVDAVAEAAAEEDAVALADAEGLAIMLSFVIPLLSVALGVALADAEGLAIILSSIIWPLGIMCSWFIC
jgi:hypothetical protein